MKAVQLTCILAVIGATAIIQSCKLKPTNTTTTKITPNEAVNIVPGHVTCGNLANKAFKEFFLSKYSKAVCDFDSALHYCWGGKDTLAQIYTYRAAAEIGLGNYKNALSDCDTALKLNKKQGASYLFKGAAEVYSGNYISAIKDENKAVTLLNNHTDSVELDLSTNLQIYFANDSIDFKTLDSLDMYYYYKNKKYNIYDIMYGLKYNSVDGVQGLLDMDTLYSNIATIKLHRVPYANAYEQDYSSASLYWTGYYYLQLNRPDSSVKYYTVAITFDSLDTNVGDYPSLGDFYQGQADIYFSEDSFALAIKDYLKVIKLYRHKYDNIVPSLYTKIGECELGLKQYEKGVDDEATAIAIDSTESDAYKLGKRYWLLEEGKREKAKCNLKIASGYDPDYSAGEAFSYILLGDTAKASLWLKPLPNVISDWASEAHDEIGGYNALSLEYYSLSCILALMNKQQKATHYLEMAMACGINKKRVLSEPDLNNIKDTPEFKELMKDY